MKGTKKFISILLVVMMLITCVSATFTVNASTGTLCSYYATNPSGKVGKQKTITIDGSASDWSEDMLIAQGAAWDVANHYKGGHENCVLDTYALFATWDNSNLYVGWQMVNTTDTWAREGDGPLSDGGRVLDVPLILALSVDPTSTSMSNKNTNGGPIWGQKMGLKFEQHVDHLFYMSGKPGLGEPAMFTAVDANGNTDYSSGCHTFKSSGIEYKMAETNICSSIMGLDYSTDPSDVYSDSAKWVDYKTFKGSSGTHNTKYDSFYEMKIPFSALGIDASYIQNYGIGAMLIATRGESALDCIPFDDTMLDNALGSYASDPSTSHEKDDEDVITSSFAKIGNLGGSVPVIPTTQPTTAAPTTQPTTAASTTKPIEVDPVDDTLTVNATSNLFPTATKTYDKNTNQLTLTYKFNSNFSLLNSQCVLSYDTTKLRYSASNNVSTVMPNASGVLVNTPRAGQVKISSSNISLNDFSSEKDFISVTFDVLSRGTTNVNLDVQYLGVGYYSASDTMNIAYIVDNNVINNIKTVPGFASATYSTKTEFDPAPESDELTVNVTSNLFPATKKVYDKNTKQITVEFDFSSNFDILDCQWLITYDSSKLSYSSVNKPKNIMPNTPIPVVGNPRPGEIKGSVYNLSLYEFKEESTFITMVFDVIGTGTANINLDVKYMSIGYYDDDDVLHSTHNINKSEILDLSKVTDFSTAKTTTKTVLDPGEQSDELVVNATSNLFPTATKKYDKAAKQLTVTYKFSTNFDIIDTQWLLTYDATKLSYSSSNKVKTVMPNLQGAILNAPRAGEVKGTLSTLSLVEFDKEQTFVSVVFDIIGTGNANINLDVQYLGLGFTDSADNLNRAYLVDGSKIQNINSVNGFSNAKYTTKTVFDDEEPSDEILVGDVDGDGVISIMDATEIQKYIAQLSKFSDEYMLKHGDVDGDGVISIMDATAIQKIVAQLPI